MPEFPKGDFVFWRELQQRGHFIHPHGWDHADLTKIPFSVAIQKIEDCLEEFQKNLPGFDPSAALYHLTYNRSTPAIDDYLLKRVRAIRTTGEEGRVGSGMNGEDEIKSRIYNCAWHGPGPCDEHLFSVLDDARIRQPRSMLYMLHGLDGEGWGPLQSSTLERFLDEVLEGPNLRYTPI